MSLRKSIFVSIMSLVILSPLAQAAEKVTYETDVKPILREHCYACHNQDDAEASLTLDSFEGLIAGGASGEVLVAGDPGGSRLWMLVTHQEEPTMPPDNKMPDDQLKVLRGWIEGGLLKDAGSKPMKSKKPAIAKIDAANLGKPVGEPAMPEQLFHELVLWTARTGPVDALATSAWAPLAAVAWQRQITFYNTNTHQLLGIIPYVDGVPRVVRFSRDGGLVLVAGGRHAAAGSATLFDVKTGARLITLGDELDIVLAADISPDLSLVAIGGPKKKVRVYRVADGTLAYQINKHTDWVTALGFSPDGRLLATADRSGGAQLWQAAAGHERADLRGHKGAITSLDWRADSAMLATASEDGTVRLWNPAGQQIKSVAAHPSGVLSVQFSQAGNWVTAGRDQSIKTWKSDGAAIADLGKMPGMALVAAFTHDGAKVIASDFTGEVRVIDTASKKQVATLQANPPLLAQRLAQAEQSLQQTQQKLQATKTNEATQLVALTQGQAAHTAYQDKLAKTQAALVAVKKLYEELTNALAAQQQKLTAVRQPAEQAAALLAEASKLLKQAQAESTEESETEQLAELEQLVSKSQTAHATAKQQTQQAEQDLNAATVKQQAAMKSVQAAEAALALVSSETAGLPDLAKLTEQHKQSQTEVAAVQQLLQQAEQTKAGIVAQKTRFAEAMVQFAAKARQKQTKQQELAIQSGQLETEHQQAAQKLGSHREQLTKVANQLKAIQAKLGKLQTAESTLQEQESKLATRLAAIQATLSETQQQVELIETSLQDFSAAEVLRKAYAESAK